MVEYEERHIRLLQSFFHDTWLVSQVVYGLFTLLVLHGILPDNRSVHGNFAAHENPTLCCLVEDALDALNEDTIETRLDLEIVLRLCLNIPVVNESLGFQFKAGLWFRRMMLEHDVFEMQLAR